MTEQQKAKAYDEAIKVARDIKNGNATYISNGTPIIDAIFPELREDGAEKIRKAIIKYFAEGREYLSLIPYNKEQVLAWLEKQGKQKPAWSEEDERMLNGIIEASIHHCYLNITDIDFLKSLKTRYTWKPSDEQLEALENAIRYGEEEIIGILSLLYNDLKKL